MAPAAAPYPAPAPVGVSQELRVSAARETAETIFKCLVFIITNSFNPVETRTSRDKFNSITIRDKAIGRMPNPQFKNT
jgi:hypothetical protein